MLGSLAAQGKLQLAQQSEHVPVALGAAGGPLALGQRQHDASIAIEALGHVQRLLANRARCLHDVILQLRSHRPVS